MSRRSPLIPLDALYRWFLGVARRFDELVHDVLWRGQVRVAHAKVYDILALAAHLHFQLVDGGEHIRRKPVHAGGIVPLP